VVKSGLFGQPTIEVSCALSALGTSKGRRQQLTPQFGSVQQIDRTSIDFVSSNQTPFKKVDHRTFMLATNDLMSFNYITLPAGEYWPPNG
jgi:hypothetical protein